MKIGNFSFSSYENVSLIRNFINAQLRIKYTSPPYAVEIHWEITCQTRLLDVMVLIYSSNFGLVKSSTTKLSPIRSRQCAIDREISRNSIKLKAFTVSGNAKAIFLVIAVFFSFNLNKPTCSKWISNKNAKFSDDYVHYLEFWRTCGSDELHFKK